MVFAKPKNLAIPLFIAYILLLHVFSAINVFIVGPNVTRSVSNPYVQALIGYTSAFVVRIVSTFLYIIYVNRCNPFTYLKLTTNVRKGLLWGIAGSSILIVGLCCRHLLQSTPLNLNLGLDWLNLGLVGFFEEIPFRGLVFQKLNEYMGFWPASLLGSFLFVCLHIPYWISLHKPLSSFPYSSLYVFVFALLMCFVLKRSGSLWSSIIIHGVNDLVSVM
jgi:uncharacterized protein